MIFNDGELDPREDRGQVTKALEKEKWKNLDKGYVVADDKRRLFVPFAMDSSGAVGEQGRRAFMKILARAPASERDRAIDGEEFVRGQAKAQLASRLLARIALAVHRKSSAALTNMIRSIALKTWTPPNSARGRDRRRRRGVSHVPRRG